MPHTETGLDQPNLLLVTDQPATLAALGTALAGLGQLVAVRPGAEAMYRFQQGEFAAVLLDVEESGRDAFDLASRLRDTEETWHTPILFLAPPVSPDLSAEQAYSLPAVDYLVKPPATVILRAKVAAFVEQFQHHRETQRRAEGARLRLAAIVESSEDAILGETLDGIITSWNAAAERLYGYTAAEVVGRSVSLLIPPDRAEEFVDIMARLKAGQGVRVLETVRQRKDGSRVDVALSISPIRDDTGRLVGASVIARDISERKAAEEALKEADRRKDEFLAMLAHELRNPLAPLLNGLHILRLSGADAAASEEARTMMERQIQHLSRLVDDLLDVSRITRGKIRLCQARLDLGRLVRTTVADRRPTLEAAGLVLTVATPTEPVWVVGDSTRLAQVLNNLLDNAGKFTDHGGAVSVRLDRDESGKQAVLSVRDTGIGIEPEILPRLFDVFAQADRSLERERGGLGLGLALVKGLVELHGGQVRAASDGPMKGAEFTIRLPLVKEPAALSGPPRDVRKSGRSTRVLVIEDNVDAAESLRMLLELLGHKVVVAYTGPEGVRAAEESRPEVVLCDIGLPGLDGYGVATRLRQEPATAAALLVAITGYGTEEDRRNARRAGFDHHLTKPVEPGVLLNLLAHQGPKSSV